MTTRLNHDRDFADLALNDRGRVLMVACAFPPTGGPGVQRTVKFAKYLPAFGWTPTVWASEPLPGLPEDASLLIDLPRDVKVHRLRQDRAAQVSGWIDRAAAHSDIPGVTSLNRAAARIRSRRARTLLPDDQIGWAKRSLPAVERLIRRAGIEVIYSTYSPASNHWIGLQLKRSTGLPWVADFRDLWTDDYRYDEPSSKRQAAHRALEQDILESADVVIGVSARQTDILAGHVPDQRNKFHTITNGFDPDDFPIHRRSRMGFERAVSTEEMGPGLFRIAHVGRLCRRRTPDALFDGLARFARSCGKRVCDVAFDLVGHVTAPVVERLRATGLTVQTHGEVKHAEAIERMAAAHVLLLPIPEGPNADSVIPGKLFEYLATERAILTIGPVAGETARIVTELRAGRAVPFDADRIAASLSELYQAGCEGRPERGCSRHQCEPYSRVRLAQRLGGILDELTSSERRSGGALRTADSPELVVSDAEDCRGSTSFEQREVFA